MNKRKKRAAEVLRATREKVPEPEPEISSRGEVQIGDTVVRRPVTFGGDGERPGRAMSGTVVFVHPAGRLHVVEFAFPGGRTLRESFAGVGK